MYFFHTIERGQTVYAIATMYGVTPDDIYRLNPDSKEGIKAGATLKIPQRDIVGGTAKKQDGNYIFHTIQPKETLYSLSIRYTVPATAIVKQTPVVYFHFYNWQDNPHSSDASGRFTDDGAQDRYQRN